MFGLNLWGRKNGRQGGNASVQPPSTHFRWEVDALLDSSLGYRGLGVEKREHEVVIRAELPGFEADEVDVQVQGDRLVVRAEREPRNGRERPPSRVEAAVALPHGVDADRAQASFRLGVLEVRLPLTDGSEGRRIHVQEQSGVPNRRHGRAT